MVGIWLKKTEDFVILDFVFSSVKSGRYLMDLSILILYPRVISISQIFSYLLQLFKLAALCCDRVFFHLPKNKL